MVGCLVKKDQNEESRELNSKVKKFMKSVILYALFFISNFLIATFVFSEKIHFNEII